MLLSFILAIFVIFINMIKWTEELLEKCIALLKKGYNFKAIANELNLSYQSVDSKMRRSGYKFSEVNPGIPYNYSSNKKLISKFESVNWAEIQQDYDINLITYDEIITKYKISSRGIRWAVKNNKLKFKTPSERIKIAREKGRCQTSKSQDIERYRQLCEFKFNLSNYPEEFDFDLITKHGWYKAKNKGNNLNGVSRDHMISIKFGYINKIDPKIISHPANCRLIPHKDNQKKRSKCNIKIGELLHRIECWNKKYATVVESGSGINLQN